MVLVHADAVVTELLPEDELLEVLVVEAVTDLRVVVTVRQCHPGRLDLVPRRNVRIGHEVEEVEVELVHRAASRADFEAPTSSMNSAIAAANFSGCS